MEELVAYLRARWTEEEQTIEALPEIEGVYGGLQIYASDEPWSEVLAVGADHARADIAAKRKILDEVFRYEERIDGEWGCCHSAEQIAAGECPERGPDNIPALRLLAVPYAGRDDFRAEWRL